MKRFVFLAMVVVALAGVCSDAAARGQRIPLPPSYGGNVGSWLGDGGSGPIFGFDTNMLGSDFPGGSGFGGGGGLVWDPVGGTSSGGNGSKKPPCPGDCWDPYPVGPCTPMCDCYPSMNWVGKGTCWRITYGTGDAPSCNKEGSNQCTYP